MNNIEDKVEKFLFNAVIGITGLFVLLVFFLFIAFFVKMILMLGGGDEKYCYFIDFFAYNRVGKFF